MITTEFTYNEEKNQRRGIIATIIFHVVIILLLLLPFFRYEYPPKQAPGIMIALGFEDAGANSEAFAENGKEEISESNSGTPSKDDQKVNAATEKSVKTTETQKAPEVIKQPQTVDDNSSVPVSSTKKETTKTEAEKLADKKRLEAEAVARENARKKAEEDAKKQAQYEQSKQKYGDLLGSGSGDNSSTGNKGAQDGDPNSKVLETLAKGSGRIGGGLSKRGLLSEPTFSDNTNKTGKVVISVCVDSKGRVIEAKFTQKGSTTNDAHLVDVAIKGAKKYLFSPVDVESQCGTITVDFKVK